MQRVIAGRNWRRRREAPRKAPGPVFLEFRPAHRDIAGTGLSSLGAGMEFEMANWNDPQTTRTPWGEPAASAGVVGAPRVGTVDQGLRSYMLSIYNYMTSGVLLTGIVALLFSSGGVNSPAARVFLTGGLLAWILMLAPLAIVFAMSFGANRFAKSTLQMLYWGFAVLMGLSLSTIFLVYTGGSIAATFFATAGAFAGLSLVGYTTKKDLSAFGTFLIMGVVGLIVACDDQHVRAVARPDVGDQLPRRADLRRSHGVGYAAAQGLVRATARYRVRRKDGRARGAQSLSRFHQHVPVPAALHGQQPQLIAARTASITPGVHKRAPGVFFAARPV